MRRTIRQVSTFGCRLSLFVLVSLAAICGLSLVDQALAQLEHAADAPTIGQPVETTAVPADESASGDMAHRGGQGHRPTNSVLTPLLSKTDNTENRDRSRFVIVPVATVNTGEPGRKADQLTSPSVVHSSLGRQFTLVGARPSGTS